MKLRIVLAGLMVGLAATAAETGTELFQKALTAERAAGNLEEAIKLYQRVVKEFASDRALAAKALVQEARCYEKLGKDNAVKIYEQVARDYKDQREPVATASARLAALKLVDRPAGPTGMVQRKIELPFPSTSAYEFYQTDGQREIYKDAATGALMISDLSGKDKRVIFKPKAGEQIAIYFPSRDLSIVSLGLLAGDGSVKLAMIKTDGTGDREYAAFSLAQPCFMDWSWDNRYLFGCHSAADGTLQIYRLSAPDGEIRDLRQTKGGVYRPSPDGRFLALGFTSFGKVSIMPAQGGEPQLISDDARLIDWTRDGQYLVIASKRSGSEAVYVLPIKDGRAAGAPVFVRYGPCLYGSTVANGALACQSTSPVGVEEAWLGSLDSRGHVEDWKRLDLQGTGTAPSYIRWSPDSTHISYTARDDAAKNWVVRLRDIASGEERAVYRGNTRLGCIWASQHPTLFCHDSKGQLSTVSIDSGRMEPLGVLGSIAGLFFGSDDDQTIYWADSDTLFRWDIHTQQSTVVGQISGSWNLFPNEHWLARRDKDKIEIRSIAGGDWKPLISVGDTLMAFTPDGKWLLYHHVDAAGKDSLLRVSTGGGQPERIGDFPNVLTQDGVLHTSPDGQKLVARGRTVPELWLLENFEPKQQTAR
jgi:WD40 repeat protein